uniref:Uncharacterized protein n=1 Tax=Anguilla anguilla TaxID=7936 RepID=A0A0E9SD69_ANGAN
MTATHSSASGKGLRQSYPKTMSLSHYILFAIHYIQLSIL